MKNFIFIIFSTILFTSFGQQKHFELQWNLSEEKLQGKEADEVPLFQKAQYAYGTDAIRFVKIWKTQAWIDSKSVQLKNVKYSPIATKFIDFIKIKEFSDKFNPSLGSAYGRNQIYATFTVNAIIKKGNRFYKLDAFDVDYTYSAPVQNRNSQQIVDSKWSQGDWYRFKIDRSGVQKIDRDFLKDLGVNTDQLDPSKIRIFGNGGHVMPLLNDVPYPSDISELAIKVVGGQDGSFDANDYLLFYGIANEEWSSEYDSNLNIYSDNAYYYVQIDNQNGKRVTNYQEPQAAATATYTNFISHKYYEKDEVNFTGMGRKWFEKPMGVSATTKTATIHFDALDLSKQLDCKISAAVDAGNCTLDVKLNGQALGQIYFNVVSGSIIIGSERYLQRQASANSGNLTFDLAFNNNQNFDSHLYLNYINVDAYCLLKGTGKQFLFYNPDAQNAPAGIGAYSFTQAQDITQIWDVSNPYEPKIIDENTADFQLKFELGTNQKFVAVDKNDLIVPPKPEKSKMPNQNLHHEVFYFTGNFKDVDQLIITPAFLHDKAEAFAQMHREQGLNVYVADLDKIYNEFGNGTQDVASIRNFVKYVYQNASSANNKLKYLLLFGDASIDFKALIEPQYLSNGAHTNIVPIYETLDGNSLVASFGSDDYFVMLDANEGAMMISDKPDVAVGRLIVRNEADADVFLAKYKHYFSQDVKQNWRTYVSFWSDDYDKSGDRFIYNVDPLAVSIAQAHPEFNQTKIYQDAYVQQSTPAGDRYPDAKRDLLNQFEKGTLVMGYVGHGNEVQLSHERMLDMNDAKSLHNFDRLPLLTTLTCEFGRFDNPKRETAAEHLLWNSSGGVLSMVTTIREIWTSNAYAMNNTFYEAMFGLDGSGTLVKNPAEALRLAKCQSEASFMGKYNVAFLGDPGFDIAFPNPKIVMTSINGKVTDTLKALQRIHIEGEVRDAQNQLMANYSGVVSPIVFDKYIQTHTLDNDQQDQPYNFTKLGRKIFQGKADVVNGRFQFDFIVPKDINLAYGKARISFYATDMVDEQIGFNEDITVGGVDETAEDDQKPPMIEAFINDTSFVSGGITDSNPYLLLHLQDEHGINTIGGIGHDITAYLDDNQTDVFVLNDFYETDPNTYKKGKVRYRLYDIEPGWHTLHIKVWDVYNNSATATLDFQVISNEEVKIDKLLNYPNPFVNYTEFWFNHNHPFETLDVMVQVYTISGKLVWQHRQDVMTDAYLSRDISWDGRDNFGHKLAKGTYVYKLSVKTLTGKMTSKIEKLVIL